MKKIIKIFTLFIFTLSFFIRNDKVLAYDAFPNTFVGSSGVSLDDYGKPTMTYKFTGSADTPIYCIEYEKDPPVGDTCTLENQDSEAKLAGVAAIIDSVEGKFSDYTGSELANYLKRYYYASIAIHKYMEPNYPYGDSNPNPTVVNEYYAKALEAEEKVNNFDIKLSVGSSQLVLSNGYYVSDTISVNVTHGDGYKVKLSSTDAEVIDKTETTFKIRIPESVVSTGEFNITATVTTTQSYLVTARYDCGSKQDVVPDILIPSTKEKSATLTFNSKKEEKGISIMKKDKNGNALSGAVFQILDSQGNEIKDGSGNVLYKWTTTNNPYYLANFPAGTYILREIQSPNGYKNLGGDISFKVSDAGVLTLNGTFDNVSLNDGVLLVTNDPNTSLQISKQDITNSKELPGATLQILDSQGNEIKDASGNVLYKWISTKSSYYIENLPAGTYILREIIAPNGYYPISTDVKFEYSESGVVTIDANNPNVVFKNGKLVVYNNPKTKLSISKQDITNSKELPGATLQILDSQGNEIKDADGNVLYKWISTEDPHYIEGLPAGKYFLVEIIAPNGYVLSEERIEFELKENGEIVSVVMQNTPIIDVPATGYTTSWFLFSIGLISVISGAIVVYLNARRENQ